MWFSCVNCVCAVSKGISILFSFDYSVSPLIPVFSGPCSSSRARSVSMHSWTMYRALSWVGSLGSGSPYGAKTSCTLTTFSCCNRRVILTSRRACFIVTGSRVISFLIATRCPVRWSTAESTRPVTPEPRGRRSTKWPSKSKPCGKRGLSCLAMIVNSGGTKDRWRIQILPTQFKGLCFCLMHIMLNLAGDSRTWSLSMWLEYMWDVCSHVDKTHIQYHK